MNKYEQLWREQQASHKWTLPKPASRFFRLPIIRFFRAMLLTWKVERHYHFWSSNFGSIRSGYDEWVIYAIRRGWC